MAAQYGLLLVLLASWCHGLAVTFCSPDNTGSDFPPVFNQFQSNGACQQTCQPSYAFAVLQGTQCWCSNYAPPATYQENTLSCNEACPGFGAEWCGSASAGLYGYYQLNLSPSGTAAASSSGASVSSVSTTLSTPTSSSPPVVATSALASTSSIVSVLPTQTPIPSSVVSSPSSSPLHSLSETSSSTVSVTMLSAVTSSSPPQSSTFATSTTSSPGSTASANSPSSSIPGATTPAPSAALGGSVTTITAEGTVRTVTTTPSATAAPLNSPQRSSGGGGISPGKVAGIVVGVAVGLGAIIGLAVWFWLRRKHEASLRGNSPDGTLSRDSTLDPSKGLPSRQMSQMSSSGLLGKAPRIQTAGLGPTNNPRSADTGSTGVDRRSVGTDQRLNPHALYVHDESRLSSVSLQDNQDYSRQLRVANPDQ